MTQLFDTFLSQFSLACKAAGRPQGDIKILPVSKGVSVEILKKHLLLESFPKCLAENYETELVTKQRELPEIQWHYQGALQSRKIEAIMKSASVLQSVSRLKELEIIAKKRKENFLGFYLQVNLSEEGQKLGASFDEVIRLLDDVERVNLKDCFLGFMGVASDLSASSEHQVRKQFSSLREFRDKVYPRAKLSMGMSSDFHLAILEGSDLIRVGSLIFGARVY